jgi:hypothetical protein
VARGDGVGLVQLLIGRPLPDDALQLIGDGLLVASRKRSGKHLGLLASASPLYAYTGGRATTSWPTR